MSVYVLQSSDLLPLAMVMLFDFQDRKFLLHERSTKEGEESVPEVRALEGSLHRCVCSCVSGVNIMYLRVYLMLL